MTGAGGPAQLPVLIGVDWGTSSLRGYLIHADGSAMALPASSLGIMRVANGAFERTFSAYLGDSLARLPAVPVILSGMITSRNGWVEVDYQPLPADANAIARGMREYPMAGGRPLHFVPGLVRIGGDLAPDVMRGEETEIIGQLVAGDDGRQLLVLPGTHSKWVTVEGGQITDFRTFMTGEVFALLTQHSILGRLMTADGDDLAAFDEGVAHRVVHAGSILQQMFAVRTLPLLGRQPAARMRDFLSGLLVAEEIAGALAEQHVPGTVRVICATGLAERYRRALERFGIAAEIAAPGRVAIGQLALARAVGLVR